MGKIINLYLSWKRRTFALQNNIGKILQDNYKQLSNSIIFFSLAIVGKLKQTKKLEFDYFNNVATAKKILSNKKNKYINI